MKVWRSKRNFRGGKVVTLNGEFVSEEGVVFGGKTDAKSDSLLERKMRIQVLEGETAALQTRRDAVAEQLTAARARLQAAKDRLEENRQRHQAAHLSLSAARGQIQLLEREHQEAERKLEALQNEKRTLDRQIEAADGRISELEKQFADEQQTIAAQQERLRTLEAAKENALRFEADATEHVTELRLAVATERQRQENLAGQRQPMAERATELAELIAARRRDIEKYQQRIASQKQESSSAEAAIESQTAAQAAAEDAAAEIAQQRASRLAGVSAIEAELRTFRNSLDELRDLRGKEEVRQTQLQLRIDSIAENVMRRYQVDLREFETDRYAFAKTLQVQLKRRSAPAETEPAQPAPAESATAAIDDASQLQNIIAELTRQLDNMGPVNLDAVHEYDELEERFRFLETQNNDLTASRRELLDTISYINNTTQKLFAETFAQVRTNFREMFSEMFGGGRADLSLHGRERPAQLRNRDHGEAARQTTAKHIAALRRRTHHDGGRIALRHLHGAAEPVLHPRRNGCAARRKQHQPFHSRARSVR